jgi:hypothetical protein
MSRIDAATLNLVLTNNTVKNGNNSRTAKVRVFATNYNVLRIMSTSGIKKYGVAIMLVISFLQLIATLLDAGTLVILTTTIALEQSQARTVLMALPNGKNVVSMRQSADQPSSKDGVSETERQRALWLKIQSGCPLMDIRWYG